MGRIPEVLGDAVRAHGGDIHCGSSVRRILVANGRAHAVEVDGKGIVEVDAVVSTVSAMHTYASLLSTSDVPRRMLRKVKRAPLSHKSFVLQLGLANRIEAHSHANCVHPWLREQSQVFEPDEGETRWLTDMVPTMTLPELAPTGGSVVEMFLPVRQDMAPGEWNEAQKGPVVAKALARLRRDHARRLGVPRAEPQGVPGRGPSLRRRAVRPVADCGTVGALRAAHTDSRSVPGRPDDVAGVWRGRRGNVGRLCCRHADSRSNALRVVAPPHFTFDTPPDA